MIIDQAIPVGKDGVVTADRSSYEPSDEVKAVTALALKDFTTANVIKSKPFREFNNYSVLDRQSIDQMRFNGYQELNPADPDDEWKSVAVRPITRNRVVSIAAHVTGTIMYPMIYAFNEQNDEQKDAATVMRDLMEVANDQADYDRTFVQAVIAALVNPAVIIQTEYAEAFRTIKERAEDGTITKKDVLDDLYSGFQDNIVPLDEFWIADFYEPNIQKQPFLIRRRLLTFEAAQAKHGHIENFQKYVEPGVQMMYHAPTNSFYRIHELNLYDRLVEEIQYWNRAKDLYLTFVNGVIMCEAENPNPRQDKRYPFVKGGFELIHEKFFWYKSLVYKLGPDEEVVQTLYRMIIDGTYLQLMPPGIIYGSEAVASSVVAPGMITGLREDSKYEKLDIGGNLSAGMQMLEKVEESINESSVDTVTSGQRQDGNPPTAFEISRIEQNAKTMLGLFAKMIGFMVKDLGELRISDITQFMTVGEVMDIESTTGALKFRNFVVPNRTVAGKSKTRKIRFNADMPTSPLDKKAELDYGFDLMDEEGGPDSDLEIYDVNPGLFRKLKFMAKVTADVVLPPSDTLKKSFMLEEYDRAIANPLANQEAIFKDLLLGAYDATKGDPDKYVMKQTQMPQEGMMPGEVPGQNGNQPGTVTGDKAQKLNQRKQATMSDTMGSM